MNPLIDAFPNWVEVNGKRHAVHTDFRVFVLFELLMQEETVSQQDKTQLALSYFYEEIPEDIETAIEQMLWFYRGGRDIKNNLSKKRGQEKQAYSFEKDAFVIYAAFQAQYGIDLQRESMHWWRFLALFEPILNHIELHEIATCRLMDTRGMNKERAAYYRTMKRIYALEDEALARPRSCKDYHHQMKEYVARRMEDAKNTSGL